MSNFEASEMEPGTQARAIEILELRNKLSGALFDQAFQERLAAHVKTYEARNERVTADFAAVAHHVESLETFLKDVSSDLTPAIREYLHDWLKELSAHAAQYTASFNEVRATAALFPQQQETWHEMLSRGWVALEINRGIHERRVKEYFAEAEAKAQEYLNKTRGKIDEENKLLRMVREGEKQFELLDKQKEREERYAREKQLEDANKRLKVMELELDEREGQDLRKVHSTYLIIIIFIIAIGIGVIA